MILGQRAHAAGTGGHLETVSDTELDNSTARMDRFQFPVPGCQFPSPSSQFSAGLRSISLEGRRAEAALAAEADASSQQPAASDFAYDRPTGEAL